MSTSAPCLYYDPGCPVCRSFAKLLTKNLGDSIQLVPMDEGEAEQSKEFILELPEGERLSGEAAISALEKRVPQVRDYFWMLPPSYRGEALIRTYRLGKWLRKILGRKCGSCPQ